VDIPNGMHTAYSYDTRNPAPRGKIAHKDGTTVKQAFGYTLDDDGTITKITHEDGSYWDYGYDERNHAKRVAERKSASG
jgi:YD repeat-containing protein